MENHRPTPQQVTGVLTGGAPVDVVVVVVITIIH